MYLIRGSVGALSFIFTHPPEDLKKKNRTVRELRIKYATAVYYGTEYCLADTYSQYEYKMQNERFFCPPFSFFCAFRIFMLVFISNQTILAFRRYYRCTLYGGTARAMKAGVRP